MLLKNFFETQNELVFYIISEPYSSQYKSLSLFQPFCLSLYSLLSSLASPPAASLFKSPSFTRTHGISSPASRRSSSRGNERNISEQRTSYSLHICEAHVHKDAKKSPLKISHSCTASHQLLHIPASELALAFYRNSGKSGDVPA